MVKFTTRPISVEAYQLTTDNLDYIENWCNGQIKGTRLPLIDRVIAIYTEDGEYQAAISDYIIKIGNGDFCTCPAYVFNKIFTPAKGDR